MLEHVYEFLLCRSYSGIWSLVVGTVYLYKERHPRTLLESNWTLKIRMYRILLFLKHQVRNHSKISNYANKGIHIWLFYHRELVVVPNITGSVCPRPNGHTDALMFGPITNYLWSNNKKSKTSGFYLSNTWGGNREKILEIMTQKSLFS